MQSTVMCLMADTGEINPKPDYAVFADTGWEPQSVYDTLDWLAEEVEFPILRTSNGRSLREDVMNGVNAQGKPWMTLPVFLLDKSGKEAGINWRQCTKNYKIDPIRKEVQRQLGVKPRQVLPHDTNVEMWLGNHYGRVHPYEAESQLVDHTQVPIHRRCSNDTPGLHRLVLQEIP